MLLFYYFTFFHASKLVRRKSLSMFSLNTKKKLNHEELLSETEILLDKLKEEALKISKKIHENLQDKINLKNLKGDEINNIIAELDDYWTDTQNFFNKKNEKCSQLFYLKHIRVDLVQKLNSLFADQRNMLLLMKNNILMESEPCIKQLNLEQSKIKAIIDKIENKKEDFVVIKTSFKSLKEFISTRNMYLERTRKQDLQEIYSKNATIRKELHKISKEITQISQYLENELNISHHCTESKSKHIPSAPEYEAESRSLESETCNDETNALQGENDLETGERNGRVEIDANEESLYPRLTSLQ
ncbi:hypothetical protein TUBRATIS_007080 [Tubulinosema ratisbonensis]|uniref:Uncharacterized protein n=1 Tax=Tubulinosema ratisbonensis TaxID=291195 RepID=A0A437ANN7_9MICR|nr:hypothetical protein TUBRATIS_007080 [Tubulinosema ratisbonensis]